MYHVKELHTLEALEEGLHKAFAQIRAINKPLNKFVIDHVCQNPGITQSGLINLLENKKLRKKYSIGQGKTKIQATMSTSYKPLFQLGILYNREKRVGNYYKRRPIYLNRDRLNSVLDVAEQTISRYQMIRDAV